MTEIAQPSLQPAAPVSSEYVARFKRAAEFVVMPAAAILLSAVLFSIFLLILGKSPVQFFELLWRGGFGTWF